MTEAALKKHAKQKSTRNRITKFSFLCSKWFCSTSESMVVGSHRGGGNVQSFRIFSYKELRTATNGFCTLNKIGEGGFGTVYKGLLKNGAVVAVKVLSVDIETMRGEREFISELSALSNVRHDNLVTLQGCCVEGAKRFLIYDYMENSNLSKTFLGGKQNRMKFTWTLRRQISLGVARGLVYLHEETEPHIVHRDIKPSNILLDQNFIPKVADFGLSKLFRQNTSHISTRVAGTLGYLSPEYAISGHLTQKSDIYGFGVLLLVIVSGRDVVSYNVDQGEQFLVHKAWEMYKANKLLQLVDPVLNGDFEQEEAIRFFKAGLLCVQEITRNRPQMSEVLKMLTNEIDVPNINDITQPGLVADLMDVKISQKSSSTSHSLSSRGSISASPL